MIKNYIERPRDSVKAVQLTDATEKEVMELVGKSFRNRVASKDRLAGIVLVGGEWIIPGDYVIKYVDGYIGTCSPDTFEAMFIEKTLDS